MSLVGGAGVAFRWLLAVLLSLAAGSGAPVLSQEEPWVILPLKVNQVDKGEVFALLRSGDVLVAVKDLEQAGLRRFSGRREPVNGDVYVSLGSLAPGVTFELDERALVLRLTAQAAFLAPTVLDLRIGPPAGIDYREDTSAFLNYAVNTTDFEKYAAFAEAGLSLKGASLFSSASRNEDGAYVRGQSNLTWDDRPRLTRWVLGDRLARSDALGGALLMGGISVSREFGIDPYFVRFPMIELSGAVLTPSTVDVYVNGLLQRREPLAPGAFNIKNLPAPTGSGVARATIRDAFGREQEIVSPFYFSTGLLAEGLHDFSYNLGFRREEFGVESWDYTRLGFLGRHRRGITETLTAGLRLEAASDLVSGGPTVTAGFPIGEIELAAAASLEKDHGGAAGSVTYRYVGRPISFGASISALTDHYATLSLGTRDDRAKLETSVFAGARLGARAGLTVQYTRSDSRDRDATDRVSAFATLRLTDRASLFLTGSHSQQKGQRAVSEASVGLSVYFGDRTTATVAYERRDKENVGTVEAQRSLPVGTGVGYRVRARAREDSQEGLATLQYQGPYGRYEATYENIDGTGKTTLSAAGGLVALGGRVFATRPVGGSFALIRVPGVEGVRGYVDNQEVGRTNARGDLPVPELLSYYGNRLAIAHEDIPLDYTVGPREQAVAMPLRGGAVATFPVRLVRAVTGRIELLVSGQPVPPAYGELSVTAEGQRIESPIGGDGEFYLDNIPEGRHTAVVDYRGATCSFILEVPAATVPVIDLGAVRCAVE